jgi:hypothetical protein
MLDWLNGKLGDRAAIVGAIMVLVAVLSASVAYNFVRDFGVNDNSIPSSEVRQDR